MTTLGALSHSWAAAEAALPFGWQIAGLVRQGEGWLATAQEPRDEEKVAAYGPTQYQALGRLVGQVRQLRG